ncbi:MAG: UvrB/UvrC motif-containing protein [Gemmatimonadota bacterium]
MVCHQCKDREAVVHLTQIANDQVVTIHLCERCAAEKGVEGGGTLAKTPVGNFLASLGKDVAVESLVARPGESAACTHCGATLNDFRESGRLGCAECYSNFEGSLRDLLRRLHGSSRHLGERYDPPGSSVSETKISHTQLRDQLRLAIETQNFELAAELRDRLRVKE